MIVTGELSINPAFLVSAYFDAFLEAAYTIAKRLEDEAKVLLSERTLGVKSSGALAESIKGYVAFTKNQTIEIGLRASALELGQYELSAGEPEEAAWAVQAPPFDYATAVEYGTGEYFDAEKAAEADIKITPKSAKKLVFWTGDYGPTGARETVATSEVKGQRPKYFLTDAMNTSIPFIRALMDRVGRNIQLEGFTVRK